MPCYAIDETSRGMSARYPLIANGDENVSCAVVMTYNNDVASGIVGDERKSMRGGGVLL